MASPLQDSSALRRPLRCFDIRRLRASFSCLPWATDVEEILEGLVQSAELDRGIFCLIQPVDRRRGDPSKLVAHQQLVFLAKDFSCRCYCNFRKGGGKCEAPNATLEATRHVNHVVMRDMRQADVRGTKHKAPKNKEAVSRIYGPNVRLRGLQLRSTGTAVRPNGARVRKSALRRISKTMSEQWFCGLPNGAIKKLLTMSPFVGVINYLGNFPEPQSSRSSTSDSNLPKIKSLHCHPLLGQKKSPRGDPHLWQDKPSTMTATGDQSVPREERVLLAVRAYQQGQFKSTRKAAAAYDVLNRQYLIDCAMNNLKLTATEETALVQWILSMDERGCRRQWLTLRGKDPVGENWVRKFVGRHGEIKAKYSRRYDYQRAKCEDPQKIQGWYDRVAATKQKWGILDEDVYNFDETGFQMGVAATARVLTRSDRRGRAVLTQPGNREWVTVIESINCQGWALPAKVIFQGKLHQASWYESGVPDDWHIAVSENGWTSDDLALNWLKEVFDPNTRRRTVGTHRLLILDGHGSHVTPEFDKYCTANSIPLDVGCFSPLKTIYGRKVQEKMLAGIHHIDKQDFLPMYLDARRQALSPSNIRSGFMATGLFPFDPNRVLSRLQVQVDKVGNDHGDKNTPSPNKSLEAAKTPHNVNQLTTHAERLLQRRPQNTDSPVSQAINQLIKGCQMAMHSAALLADENRQLRSENQRRKQRKNSAVNTLATAVLYRIKQRREEEEERVKRRRVEEEERTKRRREKDEERAKRRQEGEERAERRRQENEEWFKLRREKEEERVKKQRAKEDERAKRRREEGSGTNDL
ncbi:DDE superfamily endonuclease [Hirsutella rhossiliensis]